MTAASDEKQTFLTALEQQEFHVAFQPVVDLKTGRIFSYEALLRPSNPAYNGPPAMIDAAIAAGMCGKFGRAIRQKAVKTGPDTRLFINIHPNELSEGWLVRPDDPIFQNEDEVFLEITESVPLTHFELCASILREVRGRGVYLAVDDLGAGYSNLKYIADLSPEIVKLDRGLIMNMQTSDRQQRLVRAIVRLCDDLGAATVAEGIETMEELEAVKHTGATYGQGYLLARPAYPAPIVPWPPKG